MTAIIDKTETLPAPVSPQFDIINTAWGAEGTFRLDRMRIVVRAESREIVERQLKLYHKALTDL